MEKPANSRLQWAELITTLGVLVSLVFVGLEIRQNTAVARGQARNELATMDQTWLISLAQDSVLQRTFSAYWNSDDPPDFSFVEDRQMQSAMIAYLRRLENAYLFAQEGLIPEAAAPGYGMRAPFWTRPGFKDDFWPLLRDSFDPGFVDFFESEVGI